MKQHISEEFTDSLKVLTIKHILDTHKLKGQLIREYSPYNIETLQGLSNSGQYGFSILEDSIETGNRLFTLKIDNIDILKEKYADILHESLPQFYNPEYQDEIIEQQLEEVLKKKNGQIIKYPQDFNFEDKELEEIEFIKTLLRLEKSGYIEVDFIPSDISYHNPIIVGENLVFTIKKTDSIKELGPLKIDKIRRELYYKGEILPKLFTPDTPLDKGAGKEEYKKIVQKREDEITRKKQGFIGAFIIVDLGITEVNEEIYSNHIKEQFYEYGELLFDDYVRSDNDLGDFMSRVRNFLEKNTSIQIPRKKDRFFTIHI